MTACMLDRASSASCLTRWLGVWHDQIRGRNGKRYSKRSLCCIFASIQRHLKWRAQDVMLQTGKVVQVPRILSDLNFTNFQRALDAACRA